jgi:APA family basic amino acid/polyamine antiporter
VASVIEAGVALAILTSLIGGTMYVGRVIYATGQDGLWPSGVSKRLGSVNRFGAPAWAVTALVVGLAVPLAIWGSLDQLVAYASGIGPVMYFLVGLATVWARKTHPSTPRPFRLPLGYVMPATVMAVTLAVFLFQGWQLTAGVAVVALVAIGLWALSRRK